MTAFPQNTRKSWRDREKLASYGRELRQKAREWLVKFAANRIREDPESE
jgi:hypothetical protein